MICDITDNYKFRHYKHHNGPFIIHFYKADDSNNYQLYYLLKSLEKDFTDVPIIRFHYLKFRFKFPMVEIPSHNHLLVIGKGQANQIYNTLDINEITKILQDVRIKRCFNKKSNNKEFRKNKLGKMKPWLINFTSLKISDVNELLNMTAEMQYNFPNSTAYLDEKKKRYYIQKKFNKLSISENISKSTNINNFLADSTDNFKFTQSPYSSLFLENETRKISNEIYQTDESLFHKETKKNDVVPITQSPKLKFSKLISTENEIPSKKFHTSDHKSFTIYNGKLQHKSIKFNKNEFQTNDKCNSTNNHSKYYITNSKISYNKSYIRESNFRFHDNSYNEKNLYRLKNFNSMPLSLSGYRNFNINWHITKNNSNV